MYRYRWILLLSRPRRAIHEVWTPVKRGYNTTGAIVLNAIDYGESDRIVTFYTTDYGKVAGIAKGARRSRKRFVNKLEPFSHITLTFFHKDGRDLVRVDECRLKENFFKLKNDL
ncbi:MAG: DNA repair protein RecO, partial [Deltaproteobacteria bacterium]|nr:DNA repair protein RecO [Deltaproteobacteria bacterium]